MHYLITGGTGAGKTLFTLQWVRALQTESGRPVCYTGRLRLKPAAESFNWKQVDIKEWEKEPDGTIFLVDECHKDFPPRAALSVPPSHIQNLAEARHRGFDFYFITQHPKNLDIFIRRLIAAPGWHRHIKRRGGAPLAAVLQWDAVCEDVEQPDVGDKTGAEVTNHAYPKYVYEWYESTSLDTARFKIPKAAYALAASAVFGPLLLWLALRAISDAPTPLSAAAAAADAPASASSGGLLGSLGVARAGPASSPASAPVTVYEYVSSYKPRVDGMPHTAPRYDTLTQPVQAPYLAACISMPSQGCRCYTQQGTLVPSVPASVCEQVVKQGYFIDWAHSGDPKKAEGPDS